MSVDAAAVGKPTIPLLKTADQYMAWKARVVDKCWALTGKDISLVTDHICEQALTKALAEDAKADAANWVGKCWLTITTALHDDILVKVAHVPRGHIQALLIEISQALMLHSAEEIQPLRLELYGATMVKEGNSDLQTYVVYLLERAKKLAAHKKAVDEEELIAVFLKGLHPLYQPLQVHFAIPGTLPKQFDEMLAIVRRYSTTPVVAAELAKLKSGGVSQSMFPITTTPQSSKAACRQFASKGTCRFGSSCKFLHVATPAATPASKPQVNTPAGKSQVKCAYCLYKGHTAAECRSRARELAALGSAVPPAALVAQTDPQELKHAVDSAVAASSQVVTPGEDPFNALVLTISNKHNISNWVMDSGATASATYDESDCTDVRDCDVQITAAGSSFSVKRMGTAAIHALDASGKVQKVTLANCLISPLFPYKLLSLQAFTKKGHTITIMADTVRIANKINDVVLVGVRDPTSQLFLLQEAPPPEATLLAKSYGAGDDLLCASRPP